MNQLACVCASIWLQTRQAGLTPATSLRLEEHLAHCSNCSEQARVLDQLQSLSDAGAAPLGKAARQRAVLRAMAVAERPSPLRAAKREWLVPSAWGALAAVAIVSLGIGLRYGSPSAPAHARGDRVVSGELERAGRLLAPGHALADQAALYTRAGAVVALAHATIELRANTRARWDGQARVLHLDAGSVMSEVDPKRREPFSVATPNFSVRVLGTSFEVSLDRVRVTRGRVQVVGLDGMARAVLDPGGSYVWTSEASVPRSTEAIAPSATSAAERASARSRPSIAEAHLAEARLALGRRDLDRARELVAQALAGAAAPRQRAEALTLRAECALVAGDLADAAAGYRAVAQRFARLPAGENALFAAARIDADRTRGPQAARGFERYLARYPNGRFVKEANARLRELQGGSAQAR